MTNCDRCPLCTTRFIQTEPTGNCTEEECELLLIGDYPRVDDNQSGYPFTGEKYNFMWEILNSVGVKYRVTYLLRCSPVDTNRMTLRKPDEGEYAACIRENLMPELRRVNPKCILFVGQGTLEAVLGSGHKVSDYRDISHSWEGYRFLATYHPDFILRAEREAMYDRFIDDLVYACRHAMKHRSEGKYKTITLSPDKFVRVARIWCDDPSIEYVGYDTESNGLDPLLKGAKITSFSVAVDRNIGYNIFMYHPELSITDDDRAVVIEAARELLTKKKVVAHHAKHEHRFCKVCWGFTPNITDDTMYMSNILYLAYPGIRHGLKFLSGRFLALPPWEEYIDQYAEIFKNMKSRKILGESAIQKYMESYPDLGLTVEEIHRFWDIIKDPNYYIKHEESAESDVFYWLVPVRVMEQYAGMDAIAPLMLMDVFKPKIDSDKGLSSAYAMMVKGANAFANIELKGMRIMDIDRWTKIYEERLVKRLEEIREFEEIREYELEKGSEFNPGSSKQCAEIFYERFKFPVKQLTGKGAPSTSSQAIVDLIKEISDSEPDSPRLKFLEAFREYKKLGKIMSAYLVGLRRFIKENNAFDGNTCTYVPVPEGEKDMHIHPGYSLHTVETGRVASSNPSMHTIPAGSDIKRLFVSHWYGRGGILFTSDQSQLELRIMASIIETYYGDSSLADAYRAGKDIHRYNASKVFAKPEEEVVDAERRFSKTISFSLLYGSSEKSVAENTGRTPQEVHELFQTFYESFPGIRKYIDDTHDYARKYGCVRTPMGRIKYVLAAQHPEDRKNYSAALRQAQNGIIQSSGSDLSFQSIVWMDEHFRNKNMRTKVVSFVHDSLTLDTYPTEWFDAYDSLLYSMKTLNEQMPWVSCPLGIDVDITNNYGDHSTIKEMVIHEDGSRTMTIKGFDYVNRDILEEAKVAYEILEDTILEEEEFFNSVGTLIAKRAISLSFDDKTFMMQKRRIRLLPKNPSTIVLL